MAPVGVLWLLAVAGLGAGAGIVALTLSDPDLPSPAWRAALTVWTTVPYVLGGVIAWWRRPESRLGPLMTLAGFAMAVGVLQRTESPLLYTVGQLVDLLIVAVFLHLYLAFPTGHLATQAERRLVAAAYALSLGLTTVISLLGGFDPRNLLALTSAPGLAEALQNVQLLTLSAVCLAAVVLLLRRPARRRRPRRPVTLLVDCFALALVMLAVLLVFGAFGLPGFEIVRLLAFAAVGLAPVAFLGGLLDARLARSKVGDLLLELRDDPPSDLTGPLARALRDPSLRLAYWLPQYQSWADSEGQPVELPAGRDGRAVTCIDRNGDHLAAIVHDSSLDDERELVAAVSAAAGIALENGRLQAQLKARLVELEGSRARVLEATQQERKRLERDLHDGAQQRLVALSLELGQLQEQVAGDPQAAVRVERVKREVATSLAELRDLARGIHPAVLSAHGLAVALESLAGQSAVPLRLDVESPGRLPEAVEVAAYYVACEGVANAGKHARASSVQVSVRQAGACLVVDVVDDGVGGVDSERGTGLRGLADRVEALGGRLRVWSAPGRGTRVQAQIPCE